MLVASTGVLAGCGSDESAKADTKVTAEPSKAKSAPAERKAAPTAEALIAEFKKAGIPVGKTLAYTEKTDGNNLLGRPGQYFAKVNWIDTRLKDGLGDFDTSDGGSLEMFKSAGDAKKRYEYVKGITSSNSAFAEYDYLHGTVFLRLATELTPSQAKQYDEIVKTAVS